MKCPKCGYLGFDTGDRCRHCGYDFSFAADEAGAPDETVGPSLVLDTPSEPHDETDRWYDQIDRALEERSEVPATSDDRVARAEQEPRAGLPAEGLPLFGFETSGDDAPIVPFPASPRAPLSVRRTPDHPRLRQVPTRAPRRRIEEPALEFDEEPAPSGVAPALRRTAAQAPPAAEPSSPGRRLTAAAIDLVILFGIDLAVVYFTLRMAALATADWRLLPPAPLAAFLLLVKIAYFSSFTAVGGQTIGKMAVGIRVVAEDGDWIDGSRAVWRTIVGTLATLVVGLGFLPALVGADRRALHDRAARTRVVSLRSA